MRIGMTLRFAVLALGVVPVSGCALFSGAEFYLGGSRVGVMPFRGPEGKWYGEHRPATAMYRQACAILRQGGATVCQSEKIAREVELHDGDTDPPWIAYGEQLRAEYVIVAHLAMWNVGKASTVGYVPGRAMLNVDVYDVENQNVTFSRTIDVSIGTGESAEDMFADVETGKEALIRLVLKEWRRIFIGGD